MTRLIDEMKRGMKRHRTVILYKIQQPNKHRNYWSCRKWNI